MDSVLSQTVENLEVIVVDNGSEDGLLGWVEDNYPACRLVRNEKNVGFSKAINQGISVSNGENILLLNADVTLEKNCLLHLIEGLNKSENIGMAGGVILYPGGETIYSSGLLISKARRLYNIGEGNRHSESGIEKSVLDSFWPCGACALYRREMLEDIKYHNEYFDEDFFFLIEDFDLAWRAERKGWKGIFCPEAVACHVGRVTFDRKYRQYLSFRNRYLLLMKNEEFNRIMKDWLQFLPYDISRLFYLLITNGLTLKAIMEILKLSSKMKDKRRNLNGCRYPISYSCKS